MINIDIIIFKISLIIFMGGCVIIGFIGILLILTGIGEIFQFPTKAILREKKFIN